MRILNVSRRTQGIVAGEMQVWISDCYILFKREEGVIAKGTSGVLFAKGTSGALT